MFYYLFIDNIKVQQKSNKNLEGACVMNKNENFTKAKEKYFKKLEQLIPIVDRVHGGNHPEFHEVRKVFNIILMMSSINCLKSLITTRFQEMFVKAMKQYTTCYQKLIRPIGIRMYLCQGDFYE